VDSLWKKGGVRQSNALPFKRLHHDPPLLITGSREPFRIAIPARPARRRNPRTSRVPWT